MNHPDQETWISYLYEEPLPPGQKAELEAHLAGCPACRAQLDTWQQVGCRLNAWTIPARRANVLSAAPLLRWAAMILLLAAGIVLGRYGLGDRPDLDSLRTQLRLEVASELQSDLEATLARAQEGQRAEVRAWLTEFAALHTDQRTQDLTAVQQALLRLDAQRRLDNASLRQDLETVAVLTDASFRLAHEQLAQVASVAGGPYPELNP